jgi:RNA recognition motif. (a.k.a. RRM, RBD, or RNP domain)
MTGSEQEISAIEDLEIPAAKIQKNDLSNEATTATVKVKEPEEQVSLSAADEPSEEIEQITEEGTATVKVKEPEEQVSLSAADEPSEEIEQITEEGTVNLLDSKLIAKPLAEEFFVDTNPFEAEKCRIEILNLPLGYENSEELLEIFSKHGKVLKIEFKTLKCVHGFIQFENQHEMLLALKAEDRREMPQGFKLSNVYINTDLVDEFTRNEERKAIRSATVVAEKKRNIDNSNRNARDRDRNQKPRRSRKRSLSPLPTYPRRNSIQKRAPSQGPFDILIIGLGDVLNSFVESVQDKCLDMRFRPDIAYLDYRDDVKGRIVSFQQSASMGCFAVLFCERKREDSRNVSMQLFSIQGTRGK